MLKIINVLLFVFMIVMNYLANAVPLNGRRTGELSAMYPNLFVPSGITFSIWGIIYLLLALFMVIQFFPANHEMISKIGWLFAISSLLNGLWIVTWHYQKLPLSLVVMAGLLIALLLINIQLKDQAFSITKAAFGIYLGWICIATIANITALLVDYQWAGFGISEQTWTIVMIVIGFLITSASVIRLNNPFLGIAVIWAFAGIAMKRQADYRSVFIVAILTAILMALVVGAGFFQRLKG